MKDNWPFEDDDKPDGVFMTIVWAILSVVFVLMVLTKIFLGF